MDKNILKPAIQLYSLRRTLTENFDDTVAKVAQMGFKGVEIAFNYGGKTPQELKELFAAHDLTVIGIYELLDKVTDPSSILYDYMAVLKCKYVTFGVSPQYFAENFAVGLELYVKSINTICSKGYIPCYHAHTHEFIDNGNGCIMDRLMNEIISEKVLFEPDTGWLQMAGQPVVPYMEKYAAKTKLIHFKDVTAGNEVTELGKGVIDFAPVYGFAKKLQAEYLIYEQDTPSVSELESAAESVEFLKNLSYR